MPARSRSRAAAATPSDRTCTTTALREAEEEIGLRACAGRAARRAPADLDVRDRLRDPPVRRDVPAGRRLGALRARGRRGARAPAPALRAGGRTRIERRGITFETDAYIVDEHLIWGATARILESAAGSERIADVTAPSRRPIACL